MLFAALFAPRITAAVAPLRRMHAGPRCSLHQGTLGGRMTVRARARFHEGQCDASPFQPAVVMLVDIPLDDSTGVKPREYPCESPQEYDSDHTGDQPTCRFQTTRHVCQSAGTAED
jgi:hypothetical protein